MVISGLEQRGELLLFLFESHTHRRSLLPGTCQAPPTTWEPRPGIPHVASFVYTRWSHARAQRLRINHKNGKCIILTI